MFCAAARIFCRFTRRKCHLAQTGVASTDTIDSPRSKPGHGEAGGWWWLEEVVVVVVVVEGGKERTRCHFGFKVCVK